MRAGNMHAFHGYFLINANPSLMHFCETKNSIGTGKMPCLPDLVTFGKSNMMHSWTALYCLLHVLALMNTVCPSVVSPGSEMKVL